LHSIVTQSLEAADGRAGSRAIETEDFDLLLVDIFMPGMDGFETIRHVCEHRPHLPILVMSGMSMEPGVPAAPDFLSMATRLGALRSIKKPFRPHELLSAITDCLEKSGRAAREA
jgi:CheY-like chemotaxis protein